jgi:hypothetical protein
MVGDIKFSSTDLNPANSNLPESSVFFKGEIVVHCVVVPSS